MDSFEEENERAQGNSTPFQLALGEQGQPSEQHAFSSAQGLPPVVQDDETIYLLDEPEDQDGLLATQYISPFQRSDAIPAVSGGPTATAPGQSISPPSAPRKARRRGLLFLFIASPVAVVMVLVLTLLAATFAAPIMTPSAGRTSAIPAKPSSAPTREPTRKAASVPQATPAAQAQPGAAINGTGTWLPKSLPTGWTDAGLTMGDAIFAERSAWSFTDHEEALDYRDVGTRTQHAGTFTAAAFILSPGGKIRFFQNDVRVVNNVLFDQVESQQIIQAAVDAVPSLVMFQTQGQNQFAWIAVSYKLHRSQLDPNDAQHQKRIEGLEMDPATNQPRVHHMGVLLLRVDPAGQGPAAPMGGTGWLVSNYGLDLAGNGLPDSVQPA